MRTKLTLLVLVGVVGLLQAVTQIAQTSKANQVLNPAYLGGMPTVEQVIQYIKGNDPIDTGARLAGAFWQLRQTVEEKRLNSESEAQSYSLVDTKRDALGLYVEERLTKRVSSQPRLKSCATGRSFERSTGVSPSRQERN